jgi:Rrf2 family cysteine metabolism transcriptional repressor
MASKVIESVGSEFSFNCVEVSAMKLSTRGRYGARMMLDLAVHHGAGYLLLKDVAARLEVSEKYLGHVIPALKQARLIKASRGAHGGYLLAREPAETCLGEVVRAVEGDIGIVECVGSPDVCHRADLCVTRRTWVALRRKIMEFLDAITLEQMAEEHRESTKSQPLMWYI